MSKSLDSVILPYRSYLKQDPTENVELEFRIRNVDHAMFSSIFSSFEGSKFELKKTVNIIYDKLNTKAKKMQHIIELTFKDDGNKETNYRSKTSVIEPVFFEDEASGTQMKLSVATERPLTNVLSTEIPQFRAKVRMSTTVTINDMEWIIDFTIVRNGTGAADLKKIVAEFIKKPISAENYLSLTGDEFMYEIEAELKDGEQRKQITSDAVIACARDLCGRNKQKNTLQQEISKLCLALGVPKTKSLKSLLPQTSALTKGSYKSIYPPMGYYITIKADGIRAVAIFDKTTCKIICDSVKVIQTRDTYKLTVIDCEYMNDTLYAFDVMYYQGKSLMSENFTTRLSYLKNVGKFPNVVIKDYIRIGDDVKESVEKLMHTTNLKNDGIIFVDPSSDSFMATKTYKWKPSEDNTIDFLVKYVKQGTYYLFVGISRAMYEKFRMQLCPEYNMLFPSFARGEQDYFPIQFSPSIQPNAFIFHSDKDDLDGKVLEMRRDEDKWVVIRERIDRENDVKLGKYFGNDYRVAEIAWLNYVDPFPLENLWEDIGSDYFIKTKDSAYSNVVAAITAMKSERIKSNLQNLSCVVDIATGKGQDLFRYQDAKVKTLVAVEYDKIAISEMMNRKYMLKSPINLRIVHADVNENYEENLAKVKYVHDDKIDAVVCNLAVHYFLGSYESLVNFVEFTSSMVKVGGLIILSFMNGAKVHALMKSIPEGETWTYRENGTVKYSIIKKYSSDKLEIAGQKIGIILPFTNGEYYDEFLVNVKALETEYAARGFAIMGTSCASEYVNGMKFTQGDTQFLDFYEDLMLKRIK